MRSLISKYFSKRLIRQLKRFRNIFKPQFHNQSYSQEGEDRILWRVFGHQKIGFYIDVGAHHPKRFSNTYIFYKKGWRGINIDAMPGSMKAFMKSRPRDINLEIPISNKPQKLTYYIFNEPALNGFSKELSLLRESLDNEYTILEKRELSTSTLEEVLDTYLIKNQLIDFISIDVEGLDFEVLQSINLTRYRPKIILIEALQNTLEHPQNDNLNEFLKEHNYYFFAKTVNTLFFKNKMDHDFN